MVKASDSKLFVWDQSILMCSLDFSELRMHCLFSMPHCEDELQVHTQVVIHKVIQLLASSMWIFWHKRAPKKSLQNLERDPDQVKHLVFPKTSSEQSTRSSSLWCRAVETFRCFRGPWANCTPLSMDFLDLRGYTNALVSWALTPQNKQGLVV